MSESEPELEEITDNELEINEEDPISIVENIDDEEEDGSDNEIEEDSDEDISDNDIPENVKNIVGMTDKVGFNEYQLLEDDENMYGGENGDDEFNKFNKELKKDYLIDFHPESINHNYDEIKALSVVRRNENNMIVDDLHKTLPILTKFERTRILGRRIMQLNSGHDAFVKIDRNIIDNKLIAEMELEGKKIPFIIRRTLPNGGAEYWNLRDLEIV